MTSDLEDRLRANFHRRAQSIHVDVPEPDLARRSVRRSRSRGLEIAAVAAALVLFAGAAMWVALAGRHDTRTPSIATTTYPVPTPGPLSQTIDPGALVSLPSPWRLQQFEFISAAIAERSVSPDATAVDADGNPLNPRSATGPFVHYQFSDDTRVLDLNFFEAGQREAQVTSPQPPVVEVRDTDGSFLDYGNDRYRIDWDEGGRTWEADGSGFSSLEGLVAVLDALRWQTDTDWADATPAGLADAILTNPRGRVSWFADSEPQLVVVSASGAPDPNEPDPPVLPVSWCRQPQPTLVVYLRTNASPSEIDEVDRFLSSADDVDSYRYFDQEASYDEFKKVFSYSPEMVASVTPADLPSSFTVVTTLANAQALAQSIQALPVVMNTLVDPCSPQPR